MTRLKSTQRVGWTKARSCAPCSPSKPHGTNHIDIIHQPPPEERSPARVSKDGHRRNRARGYPSRRPCEERGLLRMRSASLIPLVRHDWFHEIGRLDVLCRRAEPQQRQKVNLRRAKITTFTNLEEGLGSILSAAVPRLRPSSARTSKPHAGKRPRNSRRRIARRGAVRTMISNATKQNWGKVAKSSA